MQRGDDRELQEPQTKYAEIFKSAAGACQKVEEQKDGPHLSPRRSNSCLLPQSLQKRLNCKFDSEEFRAKHRAPSPRSSEDFSVVEIVSNESSSESAAT